MKPFTVVAWMGFMTTIVMSSPYVRGFDKLRAVVRLWLWQVWRRTVKRPVLIRRGRGSYFLVPPWNKLGSIIVATGLYEPCEELFVASYLRSGDVVIDVGAHVGLYTISAAARGATVYAFEPSRQAREALTRNVALLPQNRVEIAAAAVGDRNGRLFLTTGLDVSNHLVESADEGLTEEVAVVCFDALTLGCCAQIDRPITLMKIDAEGYDQQVLTGAEQTILRDRPVLIVETWGDNVVRGWLEERGFLVYLYRPETRQLVEYPKPWNRQRNLIAVHREALPEVHTRLAGGTEIPGLPRLIWRRAALDSALDASGVDWRGYGAALRP